MAEDSLYTSLDDIIKKNKQQGHGGRHEKRRRVRFYGSGPSRTGPSRRSINPRMIPYSMPQVSIPSFYSILMCVKLALLKIFFNAASFYRGRREDAWRGSWDQAVRI